MEQPLIICSKDIPCLWAMHLVGENLSYSYPVYEELILHLKDVVVSSKAVKLLSAVTHSIFNFQTKLYELARLIAPKNHNIAIHKSIDDDNQNDGVSMSSTSQMESNK